MHERRPRWKRLVRVDLIVVRRNDREGVAAHAAGSSHEACRGRSSTAATGCRALARIVRKFVSGWPDAGDNSRQWVLRRARVSPPPSPTAALSRPGERSVSTYLSSPFGPTRITPRSSRPSFSASPTFHEIVVLAPGGPTTGTPSMRPRWPTIATRCRATNRPLEMGNRGSSASAPKRDATCSAESRTKRGECGLRITYSQ